MKSAWFVPTLCLSLVSLIAAGCGESNLPDARAAEAEKTSAAKIDLKTVNDPAFHADLKKIGQEYLTYRLVDQQANWAPTLCAAPGGPPQPEFSRSDTDAPHGGKLYYLFAKQFPSYLSAAKQESPVGQAVVKESWQAEPVAAEAPHSFAKHASGAQVNPYAIRDGKQYHAGEQGELFIIYKLDPTTPGTDQGWVYGTLSADGQQVTSAGRVQSCMECHQTAGVDRLFGPKNPPPLPEPGSDPHDELSPPAAP